MKKHTDWTHHLQPGGKIIIDGKEVGTIISVRIHPKPRNVLQACWWWLKCTFGFGSTKDGSVCWYSDKFREVHDFYEHKGGDGHPAHFHKYTCTCCGKKFEI